MEFPIDEKPVVVTKVVNVHGCMSQVQFKIIIKGISIPAAAPPPS